MNPNALTLLFLTAFIGLLVATLAFAMLRFAAAARDARRNLRDRDTERVFVAAALQDALSKLKAQEQAMSARAQASEHLSHQIVTSLTAGLLVVARNGEVQILNPAGRRMLAPGEEEAGRPDREVLSDAAPLAAAIEECFATGKPVVRRTMELERGGKRVHLGVTVSLLQAPDAEAPSAICLFSDLTSVVELEEQLRLRAALARLGELTAGLAHEFRNGLATIHGYGRLLVPEALPDPYRTYVEGIRQETDALQKVVTNFLNFARPQQVVFHPVDVGELVKRAADDVLAPDGSRGSLEVTGRFATLPGDEVLLRQMFSNLLRNAVEACEGAGTQPRLTVTGSVDEPRGIATVAVEDNGPGIDRASLDRVFAPFFTTKPQGTGLGLAVVQKIAVLHDGRVTAARSAGGGARFEVVLPLVASEPSVT
jgi:signal transduction histidine kinase